jgi:nicotinamide phosphoribosyltransferase
MYVDMFHDTDGYKLSHPWMWQKLTRRARKSVYYFEPRSTKEYDFATFFGLQYTMSVLAGIFTFQDIMRASERRQHYGVPYPERAWGEVLAASKGVLPIRIRALPEGLHLPIRTPLFYVENTIDNVGEWVPGWLETLLSRVWYPTTVATLSHYIKLIIRDNMQVTCDSLDTLPYKLTDFGSRGVSSVEAAAIGGAAHLINFKSTDTLVALDFLHEFYDADYQDIGTSVPALEHSIVMAYMALEDEGEEACFRQLLATFAKPGAVVAAVSDTNDLWHAINVLWGQRLRQQVIDCGAVVAIRPDSGDVVTTMMRTLVMLDERFGCSVNSKGYKVLNHVKVVYGDGINPDSVEDLLVAIQRAGYSLDCIGTFGCGGALLQKVNRDTLGFAYKLCEVDGIPVQKNPVTDPGKASKLGFHDVVYRNGQYQVIPGHQPDTLFETVFEDGMILKQHTLNEVRARVDADSRS